MLRAVRNKQAPETHPVDEAVQLAAPEGHDETLVNVVEEAVALVPEEVVVEQAVEGVETVGVLGGCRALPLSRPLPWRCTACPPARVPRFRVKIISTHAVCAATCRPPSVDARWPLALARFSFFGLGLVCL